MKRFVFVSAFLFPIALLATTAFASEGMLSETSVKYIMYFFAIMVASFGGTAAQSATASTALEGIARNPSAADKIQTPMILGLALMESLVIFVLISVFLVG